MNTNDMLRCLTDTVGSADEVEWMRKVVADHPWRFAKTYASFCPHEYTLVKTWDNREDFKRFVEFIWNHGVEAWYGRTSEPKRYWFDHESGYYYFVVREDIGEDGKATDNVTLVNRGKIDDFVFWKDKADPDMIRCQSKIVLEQYKH